MRRARVAAVAPSTYVVAADSGVAAALALGWSVDVAVGDFDSLPPEMVERLGVLAAQVRRFPPDKEATDLELALGVAAERAPARVLVVGVEGGRPDHALANLLVASSSRFASLDVELCLDGGRAWVVRNDLRGALRAGAVVSLVAVHGDARVSLDGVRWPLRAETLHAGSSRGVSNEATGADLRLNVHEGCVLCIAPETEETNP